MNKRKLLFIITTAVLLIMTACEGGFEDPGTLENISGPNSGLTGGGVTGLGMPGGGSGGGGSGGGGGGFTVTGIPAQYNGRYAAVSVLPVGDGPLLIGFKTFITTSSWSATLAPISNGRVTIPLWNIDDIDPFASDYGIVRYFGNDTCFVTLEIYDNLIVPGNTLLYSTPTAGAGFAPVTFRNGSATKSWKDALAIF